MNPTNRRRLNPCPRTKEEPQQDGRRDVIMLKSNPIPAGWTTHKLESNNTISSVQSLSCPTLCDPMSCSTIGFSVHHQLQSLLKLMWMMPSNHLILCCPLLFLPSIFPSIHVFSNESPLRIRWLKYWSFSFSISPSN